MPNLTDTENERNNDTGTDRHTGVHADRHIYRKKQTITVTQMEAQRPDGQAVTDICHCRLRAHMLSSRQPREAGLSQAHLSGSKTAGHNGAALRADLTLAWVYLCLWPLQLELGYFLRTISLAAICTPM